MKTLYTKIENLIDNSQYTEATNLVAEKFNIKLKVISSRFDSMKWDKDGQKRNIFKLKLLRGKKSYTFDFGSSLKNSVKETNKWEQLKDTDLIEVYAGASVRDYKVIGEVKFKVTKKELQELSDIKLLEYAQTLVDSFDEDVAKYNKKQRTKDTHIKNFGSVSSAVPYITRAIKRKIDEIKREPCVSNEQLPTIKEPGMYDVLTCLQKYEVGTFEDFCGDFGYDEDSRTAEKIYKAVVKEYEAMERLFNSEELEVLQLIQ